MCAPSVARSDSVNSPHKSCRLPDTLTASRGPDGRESYNTPICRRSLPVAVAHSRSSCQLTRNRLSVPSTCSIFNPLGKSRDPFVKVKLTKSTNFPSPLKHRQFVELNRLCAIFPSALAAARQISRDTWRQ